MKDLAVVVLAAGQGTRMNSRLPKVLHTLAGRPMIEYVLESVSELSDQKPILVVGHGSDQVQGALGERVQYVVQEPQLGTGHALLQAREALHGRARHVLVLYGDMPLLSPETLRSLVQTHESSADPITMLTCFHDPSMGFGRIARAEDGRVVGIVEEAHATAGQLAIKELNPGVYCFDAAWLWEHLPHLPLSPKGEYYLTDLVGMATAEGARVGAVVVPDALQTLGVNDRLHLAEVESVLRGRVRDALMQGGVTIVDPGSAYVDAGVVVGQDTIILPNTHLQGRTRVGMSCVVGPNTVVRDSSIGDRCRVEASVVEGATVENDVSVGPFAHLRSGAHLADGVHMGNFGEVKNSYLGPGVKMGHFSYLGDATVGADVNIGAGTITCNFDGTRKLATVIEEGAFIGSDAMLVAPVRIGARARIGAGAVVTHDVPADSTAYGVPARVVKRAGDIGSADPPQSKRQPPGKEQAVKDDQLIALASQARDRAYAPYSGYAVGAALLSASGKVYTGCNVESASYGLTICAERTAVVQAVCAGEREFVAIAVVNENGGTPCGACRQVLAEFAPNMRVLVADADGKTTAYVLSELLLDAFGPSKLPAK